MLSIVQTGATHTLKAWGGKGWGGVESMQLGSSPQYANNRSWSASNNPCQTHLHEEGPLDGDWTYSQVLASSKVAEQAAPHAGNIHLPKCLQAQLIGSLLLND